MPLTHVRVRIFFDFWNFQLNWNGIKQHHGRVVQIPWKDLPNVLTTEVARSQPAKFTGAHVYASVDKDRPKDRKLSYWLHHTLSSFPGYTVEVKERKPRGTIKCTEEDCKAQILDCPTCKKPLRLAVEKGIDAAIITDLIASAFDDTYDIAVLVSGDADYAPAVQYIQKKTDKQIIQAFFKDHGDQLRTACWDHVFFEDLMPKLVVAPSTIPSVPSP